MDDYSRFILAWELKSDMAATSLIDVVQKAVKLETGMVVANTLFLVKNLFSCIWYVDIGSFYFFPLFIIIPYRTYQ
jgi:hypothetical protein